MAECTCVSNQQESQGWKGRECKGSREMELEDATGRPETGNEDLQKLLHRTDVAKRLLWVSTGQQIHESTRMNSNHSNENMTLAQSCRGYVVFVI